MDFSVYSVDVLCIGKRPDPPPKGSVSVSNVTGYRPDGVVTVPVKGISLFRFATAYNPALRHMRPLSSGHGIFTPQGRRRSVKSATYIHLLPRLRMLEVIPPLPICLHGVVLGETHRLHLCTCL
jgi:hypothetical protein